MPVKRKTTKLRQGDIIWTKETEKEKAHQGGYPEKQCLPESQTNKAETSAVF